MNKVINNLQIKISDEGSSVTTFTYSDYIINYIDELVKYNKISKQKLYETIISDERFLKEVIKKSKVSKSSNSQKIQVKQRISKKSLLILNRISQKLNLSRDYLIETSIQILHEDLNRKIKENLNSLTRVSDEVNNLYLSSNKMLKDVNENNYLMNAYSKQLGEINNDIDNLKSSIDEDLKNYKLNQWSVISNER